jgi:hypothetical protein
MLARTAGAFLLLLTPALAWGESLRRAGIAFSAVTANLRLTSLSGSGSTADPFVLGEEITDTGEAVLRVEVQDPEFGSRIGTLHAVGFLLAKRVTNRTAESWRSFSMALEFQRGEGSDYYDGLSFAQATRAGRPFRSDRFSRVREVPEPRDMVRFEDGRVAPGETATVRVAITHTEPLPRFFLVQRIEHPVAGEATETAGLAADHGRDGEGAQNAGERGPCPD